MTFKLAQAKREFEVALERLFASRHSASAVEALAGAWCRLEQARRETADAGSGQRSIDALIAASSLGSPEAVAVRGQADPEAVQRVLERADELSQVGVAPSRGNVCPHVFCSDCARVALAGYDFMAGAQAPGQPSGAISAAEHSYLDALYALVDAERAGSDDVSRCSRQAIVEWRKLLAIRAAHPDPTSAASDAEKKAKCK